MTNPIHFIRRKIALMEYARLVGKIEFVGRVLSLGSDKLGNPDRIHAYRNYAKLLNNFAKESLDKKPEALYILRAQKYLASSSALLSEAMEAIVEYPDGSLMSNEEMERLAAHSLRKKTEWMLETLGDNWISKGVCP